MRVVFVPRSVEIKPLFSELKFWVEKVGKTFKRNWNSLSGLFRFLLIFLHSVSVYWWEKACCSCGKFPVWGETLYCVIAKLRYLLRSCLRAYSISQRENLSARGNLYTGTAVSLVVVPHSKLVSQSTFCKYKKGDLTKGRHTSFFAFRKQGDIFPFFCLGTK